MLDEAIIEIVRGECDESVKRYSDMIPEDIQRCTCGSSLVRVVSEKVDAGREYTAVCAKCGNHVFGLTDDFNKDKSDYKRIIYNRVKKMAKSHKRNKPTTLQLDEITKNEKGPESENAFWIGYHKGVEYGYQATLDFINFINGKKDMEEK